MPYSTPPGYLWSTCISASRIYCLIELDEFASIFPKDQMKLIRQVPKREFSTEREEAEILPDVRGSQIDVTTCEGTKRTS
jgi:hypothetical protein